MARESGLDFSAVHEEALAVGRFIIVWRALETFVTFTSLALHRWNIGKEVEPGRAPRALRRKLSLITHCYENDPRLAHLTDVARALVVASKALADERDFIVDHSTVQPFDDLPPVRINLDRVDWPEPPADGDIRALQDIPLDVLPDTALDVLPLFNRFLGDTLDIVRPDKAD